LRKLFAKYSESERKKKPIAFSLIVPIFGGFFFFTFFLLLLLLRRRALCFK